MNTHDFYQDKLATQDSEMKKVGWDDEKKALKRYIFASHLLSWNGAKKILDVGCGLGTLNKWLNDGMLYYGVDKFRDYIMASEVDRPMMAGTLKDAVDAYGPFDAFVSLGAYTLMDDPSDYNECWNAYATDVRYMLRNDTDCTIVNTFHDVHDYSDPKLFYPKLNDIVKLSHEFASTHRLTLHFFEKYEIFAEFARHK